MTRRRLSTALLVVFGHSQGGLLTKMIAISSGSRFYDAGIKKPLDQLEISEEKRGLLRRTMFVEPLPFVKRVIFVSTPQSARRTVGASRRRAHSSATSFAGSSAPRCAW